MYQDLTLCLDPMSVLIPVEYSRKTPTTMPAPPRATGYIFLIFKRKTGAQEDDSKMTGTPTLEMYQSAAPIVGHSSDRAGFDSGTTRQKTAVFTISLGFADTRPWPVPAWPPCGTDAGNPARIEPRGLLIEPFGVNGFELRGINSPLVRRDLQSVEGVR